MFRYYLTNEVVYMDVVAVFFSQQEPKQTDVVSQLQGLHICASSLVAERNWHLELINPQVSFVMFCFWGEEALECALN